MGFNSAFKGLIFHTIGSSVGIVTSLLAGRSGARIPAGAKHFSNLQNVQTDCGTQPATYCMVGPTCVPSRK